MNAQEDEKKDVIDPLIFLKPLKRPKWNIYTIGCEGVKPDLFFKTLKEYDIGTLIDIRNDPFDAKQSDYRLIYLKQCCIDNNINYKWMGHLLACNINPIDATNCILSKINDYKLIDITIDKHTYSIPNDINSNNSSLFLKSIFNFIDLGYNNNHNNSSNNSNWCLFSFDKNAANIIGCPFRQSIANSLCYNNLANIKNIGFASNNDNDKLICKNYISKNAINYEIASKYLIKMEMSRVAENAAKNEKAKNEKTKNTPNTQNNDKNLTKDDSLFTRALCIIPNKIIWPKINELRSKYDKAYPRWMPHINIFYPFIPESHINISEIKSQLDASKIEPFEITLNEFKYFERGPSKSDENPKQIVYLQPSDNIAKMKNQSSNNNNNNNNNDDNTNNGIQHGDTKEALQKLYDTLLEIFPMCETSKNRKEFHSHLTVGQWNYDEIKNVINQLNENWMPLSFECDAIYIIERNQDKDSKFEIKHKIEFTKTHDID